MITAGNNFPSQAVTNEIGGKTNGPFEPARKRLTGIEGHRILAVYDEFIMRIELMSILPLAIRYIDRLSVDFGSNLKEQLYGFKEISNSFINHDAPFSNEIRSIVHNIISSFALNPSTFTSIKDKFLREQSPGFSELIQTLKDYRSTLLDSLLTSFNEKQSRSTYVSNIQKSQSCLAVEISELEKQRTELYMKRDSEISFNNNIIKNLKSELNTINRLNQDSLNFTKVDSSKQLKNDKIINMNKSKNLDDEIQILSKKLNSDIKQHKTGEAQLIDKKEKIEKEIENWINMYDNEMETKQNKIDDLTDHYLKYTKDLEILENKLSDLQKDYDKVVKLQAEEKAIREAEEKFLKLKIAAVRTIQKNWRRFLATRTKPKAKDKKTNKKAKKNR